MGPSDRRAKSGAFPLAYFLPRTNLDSTLETFPDSTDLPCPGESSPRKKLLGMAESSSECLGEHFFLVKLLIWGSPRVQWVRTRRPLPAASTGHPANSCRAPAAYVTASRGLTFWQCARSSVLADLGEATGAGKGARGPAGRSGRDQGWKFRRGQKRDRDAWLSRSVPSGPHLPSPAGMWAPSAADLAALGGRLEC